MRSNFKTGSRYLFTYLFMDLIAHSNSELHLWRLR